MNTCNGAIKGIFVYKDEIYNIVIALCCLDKHGVPCFIGVTHFPLLKKKKKKKTSLSLSLSLSLSMAPPWQDVPAFARIGPATAPRAPVPAASLSSWASLVPTASLPLSELSLGPSRSASRPLGWAGAHVGAEDAAVCHVSPCGCDGSQSGRAAGHGAASAAASDGLSAHEGRPARLPYSGCEGDPVPVHLPRPPPLACRPSAPSPTSSASTPRRGPAQLRAAAGRAQPRLGRARRDGGPHRRLAAARRRAARARASPSAAPTRIEYAAAVPRRRCAPALAVAPLPTGAAAGAAGRHGGATAARGCCSSTASVPAFDTGAPRIRMDGSAQAGAGGLAAARRRAAAAGGRSQPDWPFNIIYSSGTTGTPKGIVQPHAHALGARGARRELRLRPGRGDAGRHLAVLQHHAGVLLPGAGQGRHAWCWRRPKFDAGGLPGAGREARAPPTRCWCRCSTSASWRCRTSTATTCRPSA